MCDPYLELFERVELSLRRYQYPEECNHMRQPYTGMHLFQIMDTTGVGEYDVGIKITDKTDQLITDFINKRHYTNVIYLGSTAANNKYYVVNVDSVMFERIYNNKTTDAFYQNGGWNRTSEQVAEDHMRCMLETIEFFADKN